ncbi:SPFH domain-containing protein [Frankia sp. Cr1]|uniref:SPFH domain-containing protein n=1 Tax=Frankia sp. Cr1 TaxID=3073931 RepID=UPI002AD2F962|nr:SPFH domain-containing protein [Frankia sp. Cr1]
MIILLIVLIVIAVLVLLTSLRTVQQYERGLVFRFGRLRPTLRAPGLTMVVPFGVDHLVKVNMRIVAMSVPTQECITRDNVTLTVEAVVYFRVIDPVKAIVNVDNYTFAVTEVAQTSLRSVIGRSDLDHLLSDQERVNAELRAVIDEPTEKPWGVKIERVELKDLALPESMKRSMSKQAEAERERRARVITAEGEFQASRMLAQAGRVLAADPSGLQLRLLQTVVEVAAEKNSTLVMPIPVELLRFFDRVVPVADPTNTADPTDADPADADAGSAHSGAESALRLSSDRAEL